MRVKLAAVELDVSIQCRATIDTGVVNDYAERMGEGDKFPPVVLFGTKEKCWIGDGWHRIMAARQTGAEDIAAELRKGGRADALKHALSANAMHGHRRTNADKRRCVEIALREFPKLSSRAVAEMCGVSAQMVNNGRPLSNSDNATRTTTDGRQYPARREQRELEARPREIPMEEPEQPVVPPLTNVQRGRQKALEHANQAIDLLRSIPPTEPSRQEAFSLVKDWITHNQN